MKKDLTIVIFLLQFRYMKKSLFLILFILTILILLIYQGPIKQDLDYHNFIDDRKIFMIDNFWNVISNLLFLIFGLYGLINVSKENKYLVTYKTFFIGAFLTSLGSSFYHLNPTNETLFWDRLPMAIAFAAFTNLILSSYYNWKKHNQCLIIFLIVAISSVLYWHLFDDLRFYFIIQFLPILVFPFIIYQIKSPYINASYLYISLGIYILAKISEYFDSAIYQLLGHIISGHSIKHLISSIVVFIFIKMSVKTNTYID